MVENLERSGKFIAELKCKGKKRKLSEWLLSFAQSDLSLIETLYI